MSLLTKAVVKRMKEKRKNLSISLRDLQAITGISFSILSRYERGVVLPSAHTYQKLLAWVTGKPIPTAPAPTSIESRVAALENRVLALEKRK